MARLKLRAIAQAISRTKNVAFRRIFRKSQVDQVLVCSNRLRNFRLDNWLDVVVRHTAESQLAKDRRSVRGRQRHRSSEVVMHSSEGKLQVCWDSLVRWNTVLDGTVEGKPREDS